MNTDFIKAAVSEIEEYERISLHAQPDVAVSGPVVNDAVHLFAELTENATSFSAVDMPVENGPAITWQDCRADDLGDEFRERCGAAGLYRLTGQWVDGRYLLPMFGRIAETDPAGGASRWTCSPPAARSPGWPACSAAT
jgi:hypothetical protein